MSIFNVNSASFNEVYVSGSIDVSGSFFVNNFDISDISNTLTFHNLSYGRLKWDASSYDVVGECTPKKYFRFDRDASGSISEWNNASPEKISLSLSNINDYLSDATEYKNIIQKIIQEKIEDVEIKLTNVDVVNSYKIFKILSGSIHGKQFRKNLSPLYYRLNWGNGWELSHDEINPEARYDELSSLDPYGQEFWYEYVELDVEQTETSTGISSAPLNDQEFTISIYFPGTSRNRKAIFEFTSSVTPWTVPKWADKVTIYSIGAGGGGGGGSTGWGHSGSSMFMTGYDFAHHSDDIGFDFATGGGGGAGGNIAIAEFLVAKKNNILNESNIGKTLIPTSSRLNIFVGSGGSGGIGLSNNDSDYIFIEPADIFKKTNRIYEWFTVFFNDMLRFYHPQTWINYEYQIYQIFFDQWAFSSHLRFEPNDKLRLQIAKQTSLGKRGGNSFVLLDKNSNTISNKNIELVKATGGRGGLSGMSLQSHYNLWFRGGESGKHFPTTPIVQGGGSDIGNCFGNLEIIPGGHGGYGVSMPGFENLSSDSTNNIDGVLKDYNVIFYPKVKVFNIIKNKHIAPDISWNKNENKPYLKTPMGSVYDLKIGENLEINGYKKYKDDSYIQPQKLSPLGGNGGLGVIYNALINTNSHVMITASLADNSDVVNYFIKNRYYEDESKGTFTVTKGLPVHWFASSSYRILNEITFGDNERPRIKIDNTLISTFANFLNNNPINSIYEFKLQDSGSLGGLNLYQLTDGTNAMDYTSIQVADRVVTEPENGGHYGQGGGGGAASYTTNWENRNTYSKGQDGADGANGIVIVIVEEF